MEYSKKYPINNFNYSVELANLMDFIEFFRSYGELSVMDSDELKSYGDYYQVFFELPANLDSEEASPFWVVFKPEFRYGYSRWDKVEDRIEKLKIADKRRMVVQKIIASNN